MNQINGKSRKNANVSNTYYEIVIKFIFKCSIPLVTGTFDVCAYQIEELNTTNDNHKYILRRYVMGCGRFSIVLLKGDKHSH